MSVVKSLIATSLAFGLVSLIGCSSDDPDLIPPVLSNISHTDNQKILGSRTVVVSANASDESAQFSVTITHNGTSQTVTDTAGNFSAEITLADNLNNTIVITATDADNTTSETIILNYPFLDFEDGPAATVVIGQEDFISFDANRGGAMGPNKNTLNRPDGVSVINDNLYIADTLNNRVLVFSGIPDQLAAETGANSVIGQDSFTTVTDGINNNQLQRPRLIEQGDDHFFISHGLSSSRINHWLSVPNGTDVSDFVIGQSGFVTGISSTCVQNKFYGNPSSMIYVNGKLIVADAFNNRVLIWNTIPTASNALADVVVGQSDFTHCVVNSELDMTNMVVGGSPSNRNMSYPTGVWSDGTRLVVTDTDNFRVLIWNTLPTSSYAEADVVLGQGDFLSATAPTGPTATSFIPEFVYSNGNQLFVVDGQDNQRVLIWDQWPIDNPSQNNLPADGVIGAESLTVTPESLGADSTFTSVSKVTSIVNKLIVSDSDNNRVLIFEAP